jgi:hypothetical protein
MKPNGLSWPSVESGRERRDRPDRKRIEPSPLKSADGAESRKAARAAAIEFS